MSGDKGYTIKKIGKGMYKVYDSGKAREYLGPAEKSKDKKGESIASQIGFKKGGRIKYSHNRLY
jgi:hypothetical protein